MTGALVSLAGGVCLTLLTDATAPVPFMAAVTLFLAGMGIVNPIATGLALEPFGDRAGIASALLGFLQMTCAAVGTAMVGALPLPPASSYAWIVLAGTSLASLMFYLHAARSTP